MPQLSTPIISETSRAEAVKTKELAKNVCDTTPTVTETLSRVSSACLSDVTPPCFATAAGTFSSESADPIVSSDRKKIYRGMLVRSDGIHLDAVAVLFTTENTSFFASEVSALARNQLLCVGPEIYDLASTVLYNGKAVPCILEEDVGISLEDAVFSHAPIPAFNGTAATSLSPLGTPERALENEKIFYDVLDQVERLHSHGLYHRDIRAANICVKRFGPHPKDIHATLIDHELVTDYTGTDIPASAERYSRSLFVDIPQTACSTADPIRPTSIMRDLGYLCALRFELDEEMGVEHARPVDLAWGDRPIFQYTCNGGIAIRRLDRENDLIPLARELELTLIEIDQFFDMRVVSLAQERIAPGGYLDARSRMMLERHASFLLQAPIDKLARDISYRAWRDECNRIGRTPDYATFEEQPEALQASNRDQVRDIPFKIHALGYHLVRKSEADPDERIGCFSPEEIENLAFLEHRRWCDERLREGWIAGSPRDDNRRIHPDLVPYNELSGQSKEYDRVAARTILTILDQAGFAVVR